MFSSSSPGVMGCSYNGNTLGSHLSNPGSTPGLVHMADYHYPSAPKQYATMWWDMHGAGQVLMKVKVIRQRPDGSALNGITLTSG